MIAPRITIRRAAPADIETIADVHARSWHFTYDELLPAPLNEQLLGDRDDRVGRWRAMVAGRSGLTPVWVAARGAGAVGAAVWGPTRDSDGSPEVAELYGIFLDPDAIGVGIGRRLIERVVSDIAQAGFSVATLWVLETNHRARGFYDAVGWAADGGRKVDERPSGALHEVRYRLILQRGRRRNDGQRATRAS